MAFTVRMSTNIHDESGVGRADQGPAKAVEVDMLGTIPVQKSNTCIQLEVRSQSNSS
jgi:hypothetical protein